MTFEGGEKSESSSETGDEQERRFKCLLDVIFCFQVVFGEISTSITEGRWSRIFSYVEFFQYLFDMLLFGLFEETAQRNVAFTPPIDFTQRSRCLGCLKIDDHVMHVSPIHHLLSLPSSIHVRVLRESRRSICRRGFRLVRPYLCSNERSYWYRTEVVVRDGLRLEEKRVLDRSNEDLTLELTQCQADLIEKLL